MICPISFDLPKRARKMRGRGAHRHCRAFFCNKTQRTSLPYSVNTSILLVHLIYLAGELVAAQLGFNGPVQSRARSSPGTQTGKSSGWKARADKVQRFRYISRLASRRGFIPGRLRLSLSSTLLSILLSRVSLLVEFRQVISTSQALPGVRW